MKHLFLSLLLIVVSHLLFAQTIEKAKELLKANKLTEAKTEIDNLLAQEKFQKNPEAWYTKAKIYNAVATDGALVKTFSSARQDAFNALKKYTEIDDRMLISLQIDGYKPINDIYTGYYQEAATDFNARNYDKAFTGFVNAIAVSRFMNDKGWINLPLDTNSVLYAGVAAEKLNKLDDAAFYYSKLTVARVKGEGFVEIYKWVANYYYEKKNYTEAAKMLSIGKEQYPADPFWPSLELDMTRISGSKAQLFAKYEEVLASQPSNYLYLYNYAVELYQEGYNTDPSKRPSNSDALIKKAQDNLKKALQINPAYTRGQLFMGQISYNAGVDILKTDKNAALKKFDEAEPYLLQVEKLLALQQKLSADDKADLKEALDLLITIYEQKGLKDKMKEYEVKFNEVDKKN